jgi:dihydroorotate dehydrogenase electron transfer subunit
MLRLAGCDDPLIGRPLAVYDLDAAGTLDLIYHVKGKFTTRLAQCLPGQWVNVWGPLGNGFPPLTCTHLVLVAGGVGHTPLFTLAKEQLGRQSFGRPPRNPRPARRITFCFGTQSSDLMAGVDDFRALGIDVRLATEDGSAGHHGLVTDLLQPLLSESAEACDTTSLHVVCCGPVAMMRSVAEMAAERQVACLVSLETPMACGIGICFSCVARIRSTTGDWDYRRTCVEGPVFDATRVVW